jgi:hypothetical protein
MTKKQCPLGEDCDLTIAWMSGAEDARDRAKARIAALEAKLAKAVQALDRIAGKAPYADDPYDIARAALAELKGDKT